MGTAHGSYEALVADPAVDVVYVATPHNFHLPHALLAIEAGKHVLVEKPVGLDAAEARQIGEAADRAGVFCMEAMWTLFLPKFDVVRQLLADGALGDVVAVHADMGERFDPPHRITLPELAGGPLLDLGTYAVTFATWVLGAPDERGRGGDPGTGRRRTASSPSPCGRLEAARPRCTRRCWPTARRRPASSGPRVASSSAPGSTSPAPPRCTRDRVRRCTGRRTRVEHTALHFEAAEVARRVGAGETGSPLRPWADTVTTLDVMDRVREATGLDFDAARRARDS